MSGMHRVAILSSIAEDEENSPRKKLQKDPPTMAVSPMSSIVRDLRNSCLDSAFDSPTRRNGDRANGNRDLSGTHRRSGHDSNEELFKNAFKIRSTPENTVKSKPKARRLLGMASRHFFSPENTSPSVDKENGSAATCSPRTSSPQKIPLIGAKKSRYPLEDCDPNSQDSGYGASFSEREEKSRGDGGFRFAEPMAVAPRRTSIESRSPMESPLRSSPLRSSPLRSPPLRSSPPMANNRASTRPGTRVANRPGRRTRPARPSLFRSLSSGYESMDDGFNDLIDIDALDDTTRLPNGISTLLSGDIVVGVGGGTSELSLTSLAENTASTTPEFSRSKSTVAAVSTSTSTTTGNGPRRSTSLRDNQSGRHEKSGSSALSKVRSCLFRSPTASSSTANLAFESDDEDDRRRRMVVGIENVRFGNALVSPLNGSRSFKRPEPPVEDSPKLVKRSRRSSSFVDVSEAVATIPMTIPKPVALQRSFSETEAHANIKSAIHRSTTDTDLTGDFSKPCVLPLATGQHEDLKSISSETLAGLIRGEFNDRIGSFKIVDCRYPYEFDGGHVRGALNLYSKDLIEQILLDPLTSSTPAIHSDTNKRNILVFHCEFSWERGPNLSRFLRNIDRQRNKEHYPALHYPEVYLLHGGYEQFYREQGELCAPQGYRPMRHPDNEADLKQFRSKSKSWQGERSRLNGLTTRTNLKRLGF